MRECDQKGSWRPTEWILCPKPAAHILRESLKRPTRLRVRNHLRFRTDASVRRCNSPGDDGASIEPILREERVNIRRGWFVTRYEQHAKCHASAPTADVP